MASSKEYLQFILEQLSDLEEINYRAMMGEYIIYYRDKIVGGIYDDSLLKEISSFFLVTIDELLSGEKLISIAEKENKSNLQNVCELLIGILDIFSFLLIVLPLYPRHIGNYVSAVSLFGYSETSVFNRNVYWGIFIVLMILGVIKIVMLQLKAVKGKKVLQISSMVINIVAVMFLALARETYATVLIFLLFRMKGILAVKGKSFGYMIMMFLLK